MVAQGPARSTAREKSPSDWGPVWWELWAAMEVPLSTLICTVIIQHIPLLQLIKFGQEIFRSQHATSGLYVYFVNQPSDTVAQQSLQIITSVPMLAHAQLTQLNATQCNSHTSDNTVIHPVYHHATYCNSMEPY